jgi:hypothetical protein
MVKAWVPNRAMVCEQGCEMHHAQRNLAVPASLVSFVGAAESAAAVQSVRSSGRRAQNAMAGSASISGLGWQ